MMRVSDLWRRWTLTADEHHVYQIGWVKGWFTGFLVGAGNGSLLVYLAFYLGWVHGS